MTDTPSTPAGWWDQPIATPRHLLTGFIVWTVLDMLKITLEHLL